jgi:EAL and modified HD-GYP domain-containing signal transduction protein
MVLNLLSNIRATVKVTLHSADERFRTVPMATNPLTATERGSALENWAGETRYVSRQPILNLRGHVHGYELLFRGDPKAVLRGGDDMAARTMLDNEVIFGLDGMTNGLPAFIRCTTESLTEDLVLVLSPDRTVLVLPSELELTSRLLESCRKLKARGFRLALDDFSWRTTVRPLAAVADYVRIEPSRFGVEERQFLRGLGSTPPALIAKKVETQEQFKHAWGEGISLFQGGYFCRPVLLKKRKLPPNRLLHFKIVQLLHHDPIDLRQVSGLVQQDASLTFRLLRLVNSPLYAIQQEVRSIESAIIAVGETTFRRIVSLAVLSELNSEEPPEILHMALLRARFCELAAESCELDPAEQYLLGMLSLVPVMLRLPMEELTPLLPLRSEICEALQGMENRERSLLGWLECNERADWEACDRLCEANGLSQRQLIQGYAESAAWAYAALRSTA